MRTVTGGAAFDFCRRVFVNERSTLLNVALSAGLRRCLDEARGIQRAVSVVAVCAPHQSFWNTMVNGLRELSSDGGMTGVAKIRLGSFEQAVFKPSDIVRPLRHLKELLLTILKIASTVIFDFIDEVA